jgi:hypothetical protein
LIHLLCLACLRINITILPTFYVYMALLLQYNLVFNNGVNVFFGIIIVLGHRLKKENITLWIIIGVHCMNHYTNFKVQNVSKMSTQILNMCYNVCMHITTTTLVPMSRVSSCIYNLILEAFWKVQNLTIIGHLKVGKCGKNVKFIRGPTNVVTKNIPIKYISSISWISQSSYFFRINM